MPITVVELPGYLHRIAGKLKAEAPIRAAHAMGDAYIRVVVQSMHGPSPSPPGTPPARVTGTLARSIRKFGGHSAGEYAFQISVAPHTVYARIQQLGGHIYPKHTLRAGPREAGSAQSPLAYGELGFLRWTSGGETHFSRHVYLPKRPYMVMSPAARTDCHNAAKNAVIGML
jgi:phage gpG-like protein